MADNFDLDEILDEYSDKAKGVAPLSDTDVDELINMTRPAEGGAVGEDLKKKDSVHNIIDESIFDEVIDDGAGAGYDSQGYAAQTSASGDKQDGIDGLDVDSLVDDAISGAMEEEPQSTAYEDPTLVDDIPKQVSLDDFVVPSVEIASDDDFLTDEDDIEGEGLAGRIRSKREQERLEEEQAEKEGFEAGLESRFRLRKTSGNTAIIEGLLKLKKERGTVRRETKISPVKRLKIKDVDLHLEGKLIPRTEQLDKIKLGGADDLDFPEGATDTMKLRILAEKRRDKVDNFVLETDKNKKSDVKDSEVTKHVKDFNDYKEAPGVLDDILQLKSNLIIRLCILVLTAFFSTYIAFANDFGWAIIDTFRRTSAESFVFTNIILGLVSAFVSYTVLFAGTKKLFKRQADCDSIAALGIISALITSAVVFIDPSIMQTKAYNLYMSSAILGLLFNTLGKLLIINRTERNFRYVAGEYNKYAVVNILNEDVASKFTKGALNDFPELATVRKTEFNSDFLQHSYATDIADRYSKKYAPILLIVSAVVALLALLLDRNASGVGQKIMAVFITWSGVISIASSLALMLIVNLPLSRASKRYLLSSGVMLGYSAVEEFSDTNSILIDSRQIFPEGMISLVNLKAMSSTMIEDCILIAASLACQAGSVLQPMFYNMLRGKTEMLYPVESYIYEDGLGLSGWIENKRVLFGTRELMENHSIEGLPTKAKESEYTKGHQPIYLSISGVVATLFVIQINPSISVKKWLNSLEEQGITTVIRSVDGFVSLNLLSELFDVSPDSLKLLPFRYHKEYEEQTDFIQKSSASMLCSGHFPSFAMLICGAKKLQFIANLGITIQLAAGILGLLIAFVMLVIGSFSSLTASVAVLYNLVWMALTLIIQQFKKP